ncbi:MAG: lipopolysaccharide biosynthesis protein [Salinivirgaceae bacterium]|nr:lipopolysaccharide biosynthesis protein [Salinivirgaceae bacterium]
MSAIDQKRIAKNTLLLYLRIGLVMLVGLYTSRVVLDALGEVDFGIYNAVGGIVMMFSFLSSTMSTSCQRFYSYEMGRGNYDELRRTFSLSILVFTAIMFVVSALAEGSGIWLLYNKMHLEDRFDAAWWVLHCSVVSFMFTIMRTPFVGMVFAKEKMKFFAYLSVIEVLGNLGVAFLIARHGGDRLIFYSLLMIAVNASVTMFYLVYCRMFYPECKFSFYWDKKRFLEIFSFAGWNMIGSLSNICKSHGLNILLNTFFSPAVNAARGLAYKIFVSLQAFAENFYWAVRPQIIKSYSAGDRAAMLKLVCQSSKFSYYLMLAMSLPVFVETPFLLGIWLKEVPDYTVIFTRLAIINSVIESITNPMAAAMQAHGKIRDYNLVVGGFILTILPISYLLLRFGFPPETVFYVSIAVCALAVVVRLLFVRRYVGLSLRAYTRDVLVPAAVVTVLVSIFPGIVAWMVENEVIRFFAVISVSLAATALAVLFVGLTASERKNILGIVTKFVRIKKNEQ